MCVTIVGTTSGWPFLLLLEIIPAATSVLVLPWLPESPRYLLLNKGKREMAKKGIYNNESCPKLGGGCTKARKSGTQIQIISTHSRFIRMYGNSTSQL